MTTAWKFALGATVAMVVSATSCVEDTSSEGGDDGSEGQADDGGTHDCTPNDSDGMTQCTSDTCVPAQYCDPFTGSCAGGCESTLNCALGDYCDKRMPTESFDGSLEIGICRTPGAECGAGDENASDENASDPGETTAVADETGSTEECSDWQDNYAVSLDADSPAVCNDAFSGTEMCSLTQDGCDLTWGCDGNFGVTFPPGPVDANDEYHGIGMYMGIAFECTVSFYYAASYAFTWQCSANVMGMPVLCEGIGR